MAKLGVQTPLLTLPEIMRVSDELRMYAGATSGRVPLKREEPFVLPLRDVVRPQLKLPIQALLVDDDEKLAHSVRMEIELEGGSMVWARTAEDALRCLSQSHFDVVLLDLVLPGKSGLQLLLLMRQKRIDTPVVVITARDTVRDRILGLDSGADDYLVKPFSLSELSARMRALVRRHKPGPTRNLRCADLEIDVKTHTAVRTGVPLPLTLREFEILEYLCHNRNCVVSREMLARDIWKETNRYSPLDNVINVHMARLRRKVDGNSEQKLLHTVRRVGFILREEAA